MKKLALGVLMITFAVLLGCAQSNQPPTSSQTQPMQQPDKTGSDGGGGGMH